MPSTELEALREALAGSKSARSRSTITLYPPGDLGTFVKGALLALRRGEELTFDDSLLGRTTVWLDDEVLYRHPGLGKPIYNNADKVLHLETLWSQRLGREPVDETLRVYWGKDD